MRQARLTTRRGLTLLELMLALTVTALVAAAISGMMAAVTTGVNSRRDSRAVMVRASAAESRVSAYVAPSRCVLRVNPVSLVLWMSDDRESETVHATEVRWLLFSPESGSLDVCYVKFPDSWTQAAKDLQDQVHPRDSDWILVLSTYRSNGWTVEYPIVDGLDNARFSADSDIPLDARHVSIDLKFHTETGSMDTTIAATINRHLVPVS
ncbi:MAG: prepilin-type N-terminal cleavage/methylation domain-containing protein [Phycisphaerales bacterium]|nr:MAG: prepilin-type N-terminal cleavage/methylation domain-containing protein [Phycisphaerales bacterium]